MPEAPHPYGEAPRGVTAGDVERAADSLLRAGDRPTIEKIRQKLGTGSPNTINPLLDAWWKKLSARLDAGPAALHRLPESVAHVAEALWMQALDEGRRRAAQEQRSSERALTTDKQNLEVRSHVLNLREGELESRLRDRERKQAALEAQVQDLTLLLKKEQATRAAQVRRIAELEQQLSVRAAPPVTPKQPRARVQLKSRATNLRRHAKRTDKSSRPTKAKAARKRTPSKRPTKTRRRR